MGAPGKNEEEFKTIQVIIPSYQIYRLQGFLNELGREHNESNARFTSIGFIEETQLPDGNSIMDEFSDIDSAVKDNQFVEINLQRFLEEMKKAQESGMNPTCAVIGGGGLDKFVIGGELLILGIGQKELKNIAGVEIIFDKEKPKGEIIFIDNLGRYQYNRLQEHNRKAETAAIIEKSKKEIPATDASKEWCMNCKKETRTYEMNRKSFCDGCHTTRLEVVIK